jgi:outer membrane protein insertion porin family
LFSVLQTEKKGLKSRRIRHWADLFRSRVVLLAAVVALFCLLTPVAAAGTTITFTGNHTFSADELLQTAGEDLGRQGESSPSKAAADDAAFSMEVFYRQSGFAFAVVTYEFTSNSGDGQIVFHIEEGSRVDLRSIELTGKLYYNPATLRTFFENNGKNGLLVTRKHYYVKKHLAAGLSSLREFYVNEGFLDVQVANPELVFTPERDGVTATIAILEGPRYRIRDIIFSGDVPNELAAKLEGIRDTLLDSPYYVRQKLLLQSRIFELYANAGYPDARVDVNAVSDPATGDITLLGAIVSGGQVRIAAVFVNGNEQTREAFVRSRVKLQSGDLYTREKIREAFGSLYATGLFSRVEVELGKADEDPARRPLEVLVEELPAREFYIEPGWGSYEMLSLTAGFEHRNMFGSGKQGRVAGKLSMKGELFSLRLVDPWFLGSQTVADIPFSYTRREEPSFTRHEIGGSFMLSRNLRERLTLTLGYHMKLSEITSLDELAEIESPETNYNTSSIKAQLAWDSRDDYFFPQKGGRLAGALEVAHPALGGDIEFTRLTMGARYFSSLPGGVVLGLRYDTGLILPGSRNVILPLSEKFFNGGENSVRSFTEAQLGPLDSSGDPIGGLGYNTFTIELRKRLAGNLSGNLFADFGNVAPNRSRSELGLAPFASRSEIIKATTRDFFSDFRPGLGFGMQYFFPIGPARLDIAFNPDNDPDRDEPDMTVHFSLGMAF